MARDAGVAGNLPRMYAYRFLRDFLLVMPAMVPLQRACGLGATQILAVQAVFSIASMCFELPSGFIADVVGRRRALIAGAGCTSLALAAYAAAQGLAWFMAAEIVMALGYSLISGTESAMIFDSLRRAGREESYRRVEGRAEALTRTGTAIAALAGGALAALALRLPFAVNSATAVVMVLIALGLVEPARDALERRAPARQILRIASESLRDGRIASATVLGAGIFATGVIGIWGYLMRLTDSGVGPVGVGLFFAAFQGGSAIGAAGSERIGAVLGRGSYAVLGVVPLVLGACAIWDGPLPVMAAPLAALAWGFSTPLLLQIVNRATSSDRRATVLSVSAMAGRILFVVLAPLFGFAVDRGLGRWGFGVLALVIVISAAAAGVIRVARGSGLRSG